MVFDPDNVCLYEFIDFRVIKLRVTHLRRVHVTPHAILRTPVPRGKGGLRTVTCRLSDTTILYWAQNRVRLTAHG